MKSWWPCDIRRPAKSENQFFQPIYQTTFYSGKVFAMSWHAQKISLPAQHTVRLIPSGTYAMDVIVPKHVVRISSRRGLSCLEPKVTPTKKRKFLGFGHYFWGQSPLTLLFSHFYYFILLFRSGGGGAWSPCPSPLGYVPALYRTCPFQIA